MKETIGMGEGWEILREWLPKDLTGLAKEAGFMQRASGLQDAEVWLRLLLRRLELSRKILTLLLRRLCWRCSTLGKTSFLAAL